MSKGGTGKIKRLTPKEPQKERKIMGENTRDSVLSSSRADRSKKNRKEISYLKVGANVTR